MEPNHPCKDPNMRCSAGRLVCICKDGYRLDSTGKQCVPDGASMSEIDCTNDNDCKLLPNSQCNIVQGNATLILLHHQKFNAN